MAAISGAKIKLKKPSTPEEWEVRNKFEELIRAQKVTREIKSDKPLYEKILALAKQAKADSAELLAELIEDQSENEAGEA